MHHLSEKMQFPHFVFSQVVHRALVRRGGIVKYLLIAYFVSNICAKIIKIYLCMSDL